jgi:hypothetical protein
MMNRVASQIPRYVRFGSFSTEMVKAQARTCPLQLR